MLICTVCSEIGHGWRLEARAVQYAISLTLLLLGLVRRRVEHHVLLAAVGRVVNALEIEFLDGALRRFHEIPLVVVVHLTALHALHRLVNAVHRQLALLVVHGDELVARVLRHVHEGLALVVVLRDGCPAGGHAWVHAHQVGRDHWDLLII